MIREVAEQTHLLALNAAIEAAQAGDDGLGFSVVAREVRELATRTKDSAGEIQRIIEQLQFGTQEALRVMRDGNEQAKRSLTQAGVAGHAFDSIAQAVSTISEMNVQIATAAAEQRAATSEIAGNVVRISGVASKTATESREVAEASRELAALSAKLEELVGQFKVGVSRVA